MGFAFSHSTFNIEHSTFNISLLNAMSPFRTELKNLIRLAAPLAAAQAGTQVMGLVDLAVVGRLGARELGAAGLGNAIFFTISILGMGIVFGVDPMISQAFGGRDPVRARHVLWQGIWLAIGVTIVLTIPLVLSPMLLPLFGVESSLRPMAIQFVLVRAAGLGPMLLFIVIRAYLQAQHITRPMVVAMLFGNVFNLVSDIVLVFGYGPFPRMGVAGAALSTDMGAVLQLAIVAWTVKSVHLPPHDAGALHHINWPEIRQAIRLGFPIGIQMAAELGVFALVGLLAGHLGAIDLAAHQLVLAFASLTFTIAVGVASAGSVRVGLAVGARDQARTRTAGFAAIIGGSGFMLIGASIFALFPRAVAHLLTDEETVIAASVPILLIAAVFQLSDGLQAIAAGVLRGAGDTGFPLAVNLIGHWLFGLPIALYLGFHRNMGIVGLWWGLCAGLTAVAILLLFRFNRLSKTAIVPITRKA
jgi:MATE family multidrug resistance protein